MERATKETLERRLENVNRRLRQHHSVYRYDVLYDVPFESSALVRLFRYNADGGESITAGTKSEIAHYLWLMMVALDDANAITLEREV